jgi:putative heme-binding domain-containing protein
VQLANGPDGALYIVDMYREVIEHPWSLPDDIREKLDLHSGHERGRIWRVVPDGFVARKPPHLSTATTAELVALLEHPNGWHRDTAARRLFQLQDPAAIPLLENLLRESKSPVGRLRALCALQGQGALEKSHLLAALRDPDAHVRRRAVLLSEDFMHGENCPAELWLALQQLTDDPAIEVRYQLAFSLGEARQSERVAAMARLARRDFANPSMQAAIISSIAGHEAEVLGQLAAVPEVVGADPGREFLRQLASLIGRRGDKQGVEAVVSLIGGKIDGGFAFSLAAALREGLRDPADAPLVDLLARARSAAADRAAGEALRVEAIRLLGTTSLADSGSVLLPLLDAGEPQAVQLATVAALDRFADARVGAELVRVFSSLAPRVRSAALAALLKRPDRVTCLLDAIAGGKLRPSDVPSAQAGFLRRHADRAVRALAAKVLPADARGRQEIIAAFQPALELTGDAARGRVIYQQRCSSCHRLSGEGFAVGPDLTTVRNDGKAKTLVNILDPNREVAPNYVAYLVETRSGDSVVGVVTETASAVTVRQPFGKETTVLRPGIRRIESQRLSLMPEGLEQGLKPQDVADLLEWVFTAPVQR